MAHWHPKWIVFGAIVLFYASAGLTLILGPLTWDAKDLLAIVSLALATLTGAAFGIWGEARNRNPKGYLDRFTCAGYIVISSFSFVFGGGTYQKLFIQRGLKEDAASEAKATAEAAKRHAEAEASREKKEADQAREQIERLQRDLKAAWKAADENDRTAIGKLTELQEAARSNPALKKALDELAKHVTGELPLGTLAKGLLAIHQQVDELKRVKDILTTDLPDIQSKLKAVADDIAVLRSAAPPTSSTGGTDGSSSGAAGAGAGGMGGSDLSSAGSGSGGAGPALLSAAQP